MTKKLKPVHPRKILREEFMLPLGMRMNRVAMDLRVPVTRIADIVNEKRAITADTAPRIWFILIALRGFSSPCHGLDSRVLV
jgi:addiction module HigA family antidote